MKILHWPQTLAWTIFERVGGVARPAPAHVNLLKTLAQTAMMWLLFLVCGPTLCLQLAGWCGLPGWHRGHPLWQLLGGLVFLAGWALAAASAWHMVHQGHGTPLPTDCPRRLVVSGPYRYIRNPMALGSLAQAAAIGVIWGSVPVLVYTALGAWMWNYMARPWEEFDLTRRFGADYSHYQSAVRCWLPRHRPYT